MGFPSPDLLRSRVTNPVCVQGPDVKLKEGLRDSSKPETTGETVAVEGCEGSVLRQKEDRVTDEVQEGVVTGPHPLGGPDRTPDPEEVGTIEGPPRVGQWVGVRGCKYEKKKMGVGLQRMIYTLFEIV